MRSKVILIVVALLLGGLAAVFAAQYLNSAQSKIQAQVKPVEVLVAQQDIARGTSADELVEKKLVALEEVPQQFVASGAVSSIRAIAGQVLAVPLSTGEQLTVGRFQFPSEAGLAYNVPEDYVAISIEVDDVNSVSGFVRPGDSVALMATIELPVTATGQGAQQPQPITKTLVPKARVLAVGSRTGVEKVQTDEDTAGTFGSASASGGAQSGPQTVTIALSQVDAERVVFVENAGASGTRSLWLALLPVRSTGLQATPGQTFQTVLE